MRRVRGEAQCRVKAKRGESEHEKKGIEMKIPSFKRNFKALCALAKSHGHTKRTLSQQQRLMG